jgi:hypothetical protein
MNKKKEILGIFLSIIFLFTVFFLVFFNNNFLKKQNFSEESKAQNIFLVIDFDLGEKKYFELELENNSTAFSALQKVASAENIDLSVDNYEVGVFIKSIGGIDNGYNGKYWMYYVNGEMPSVAADKKNLVSGDKVEFKFEKSPF